MKTKTKRNITIDEILISLYEKELISKGMKLSTRLSLLIENDLKNNFIISQKGKK